MVTKYELIIAEVDYEPFSELLKNDDKELSDREIEDLKKKIKKLRTLNSNTPNNENGATQTMNNVN